MTWIRRVRRELAGRIEASGPVLEPWPPEGGGDRHPTRRVPVGAPETGTVLEQADAVIADALDALRICRCGHRVDWHRHHRRGTDCSGCDCPAPRSNRT